MICSWIHFLIHPPFEWRAAEKRGIKPSGMLSIDFDRNIDESHEGKSLQSQRRGGGCGFGKEGCPRGCLFGELFNFRLGLWWSIILEVSVVSLSIHRTPIVSMTGPGMRVKADDFFPKSLRSVTDYPYSYVYNSIEYSSYRPTQKKNSVQPGNTNTTENQSGSITAWMNRLFYFPIPPPIPITTSLLLPPSPSASPLSSAPAASPSSSDQSTRPPSWAPESPTTSSSDSIRAWKRTQRQKYPRPNCKLLRSVLFSPPYTYM